MSALLPYPLLRALRHLRITTKSAAWGVDQGERQSVRTGSSIEFKDYREYEPGDDFRSIDWNLYHRLDRLFVKVFTEERNRTLTIVLDLSGSMYLGDPAKADYCKQVAAALGFIGLWGGDAVRIAELGPPLKWKTPLLRGRDRIHTLFRTLHQAEPGGMTDLVGPLQTLAAVDKSSKQRSGELTILISDLLDENWERALETVGKTRSDRVVVHVLATDDWMPAGMGSFQLVDQESGSTLDVTLDEETLRIFHDGAQQWLSEVKSACARLGIGYFWVDTADPVETLLLQTMRERGLLH